METKQISSQAMFSCVPFGTVYVYVFLCSVWDGPTAASWGSQPQKHERSIALNAGGTHSPNK